MLIAYDRAYADSKAKGMSDEDATKFAKSTFIGRVEGYGVTGHYQNLVDDSIKTQGASRGKRDVTWGGNSYLVGDEMTVAEWRQTIVAYRDGTDLPEKARAREALDAARKALADAQALVDDAAAKEAALDDANAALKSAQTDKAASDTAVADTQSAVDKAKAAKDAADQAVSGAQAVKDQADADKAAADKVLEDARKAYDDALAKYADVAQAAKDAKAAYDAAQARLAAAQERATSSQAAWEAASGSLDAYRADAEAAARALAEAQTRLNSAQSDLQAADARLALARAAYEGFFTDVTSKTPHAEGIWWMADWGITKGYDNGDGTFRYEGMTPVYRQDMAAFLRREAKLMGVSGTDGWQPTEADWARFTDVTKDTPHAKDILWLAWTGITKGYDNGDGTYRFEGMTPVYRQDMAAFMHRLYRLAGGMEEPEGGTFTDVSDGTPHAEDIRWLAATKVSQGYDNGNGTWRYEGMTRVYRQDMAAFLHRLYRLQDGSKDPDPSVDRRAYWAVRYDAGGGSGHMTATVAETGEGAALSANAFSRDGYTFAGWAISAGGPVAYADGSSVAGPSEDGAVLSLYAVWEKAPATDPTPSSVLAPGQSPALSQTARYQAALAPERRASRSSR